ncbi:hypothetical protein [Streptomyces sp. sk2.1]|uniref:hypothetical protein n=1 Tax=Streptomyces sp. sk2.1 TaxID=2478959 RepID=UPI0011E7155E|nr:hypothetical protein [Streptomyces sp. sk2.1]
MATPATADIFYLNSYQSAQGGYNRGYAAVGGSTAIVEACDMGPGDSRRAVTTISTNAGGYYEVQDANGSNNGCVRELFVDADLIYSGLKYLMSSCIQNGFTGTPYNCATRWGVVD